MMMSLKVLAVSAIAFVGLLSTSAEAHPLVAVTFGSPAYYAPPPPPPPMYYAPVAYYRPTAHYHPIYVRSGHGYVQDAGPAFYDNCDHHDHRGQVSYRGIYQQRGRNDFRDDRHHGKDHHDKGHHDKGHHGNGRNGNVVYRR